MSLPLLVAIGNAAFVEVIGTNGNGYFVSQNHSDSITTESASEMGIDLMALFGFYQKVSALVNLNNLTLKLY